MKKKSSTKAQTSEQTHVVQAPTNPAWVDQGLQGLGGQISNLSNADPYSFVAGPDALQTQAATGAAGLTSPQGFNDAQAALKAAGSAGPASLLDNLSAYMSPYTNDVVNSTLAGFDDNAGRTRAQQQLDIAGDSTFGGSGGSILRSLTEGQLGLGRAQTEAGLRDQAFNTGAGLSNQDAQRRQDSVNQQIAAALGLSGSAAAQGANDRANISQQSDIGEMLRQIAQQRAAAPLGLLSTQAGLYSSLPLGLTHGQSTDGTSNGTSNSTTTISDPMGSISSLMQGAGSLASGLAMFSDRRLKRDVVKLGERPDGLGVYLFRYLWSPLQHIGVMAQEVLRVKPEAVIPHASGFLMVDYGRL